MFDKKKLNLLATAFFINLCAIAQNNNDTASLDKPDLMRSEGKIYVVMAIVVTIVAGLILYVARLDKKLSNLEKGE